MKYFLLVFLVCILYAPTESTFYKSTGYYTPSEPSMLKHIGKSVIRVVKSVTEEVADVISTVKNDATKNDKEIPADPTILLNIGASAVNIIKGVIEKIPEVIPSAEAFFQYSQNIIMGYPFEKVFQVINSFCSAAMSSESTKPLVTPNIADMNYILKVGDRNISVPLNKPQQLWLLKEFNPRFPLVMVIAGWTSNVNDGGSPALDVVYAAYRCRGNVNFVTVDTAGLIDTLYTWAAFNTEEIGNVISESLTYLVKIYPMQKIHLIGLSLGAHIAGSAGRNFYYKTGKRLPRITALDAANPCFNSRENVTGIQKSDAEFVLAIHSNNGGLGKKEPYGDVDFYPNGVQPLPPGCLSISCAHQRAADFYAESVYPGSEHNFMAVKCGSFSSLSENLCTGREVPMGYATPHNLEGIFLLQTNAEKPFGKNATQNAWHRCSYRRYLMD
ncbi:hepatic triacylglycerol lipase-like [Contarinia nasturtii]|uniref:hepatic triacylglycerol lipase-like n=1 Tax=Contarinia nasturtii TaxID=265458 RepID=UPI0012D4A28E|nr:hepatic triacylglycerol lipase-like [Contarinia nasturtii]